MVYYPQLKSWVLLYFDPLCDEMINSIPHFPFTQIETDFQSKPTIVNQVYGISSICAKGVEINEKVNLIFIKKVEFKCL